MEGTQALRSPSIIPCRPRMASYDTLVDLPLVLLVPLVPLLPSSPIPTLHRQSGRLVSGKSFLAEGAMITT